MSNYLSICRVALQLTILQLRIIEKDLLRNAYNYKDSIIKSKTVINLWIDVKYGNNQLNLTKNKNVQVNFDKYKIFKSCFLSKELLLNAISIQMWWLGKVLSKMGLQYSNSNITIKFIWNRSITFTAINYFGTHCNHNIIRFFV